MKYLLPILLIVFISCGNAEEGMKNLDGTILKCKSYEKKYLSIRGKNVTRKTEPYETWVHYMFGKEELYNVYLPQNQIKLKRSSVGNYRQDIETISVYSRGNTYYLYRKDLSLVHNRGSINEKTLNSYEVKTFFNCELLESYQEIEKHYEEEINKRKEIIRNNKI